MIAQIVNFRDARIADDELEIGRKHGNMDVVHVDAAARIMHRAPLVVVLFSGAQLFLYRILYIVSLLLLARNKGNRVKGGVILPCTVNDDETVVL